MTTKKNEGAAIVAKDVKNEGAAIVATDLQPVENKEVENEEVAETVAAIPVDPFENVTSYKEAKEQAALLNGETVKKIDEQINGLSVVVTDGKFDPLKFKAVFETNPAPWLDKLITLSEIPTEIAKLEGEKSAADVRKTSAKFVELFVNGIERPDEITKRLEELETGLQDSEITEDEKTEFQTEKTSLKTELSTHVLDDEQTACEELFEKLWKEWKEANAHQMRVNVFKTSSLGLHIGGVPRGTTTRKTSGSTTGTTTGGADFWQFTFAKDGKVVLQNSKQDVAYKLIIDFVKSSPVMLAAMVKKHGANWETPTSATNTSGWVGRVKDALAAGGYTSNLQKVSV